MRAAAHAMTLALLLLATPLAGAVERSFLIVVGGIGGEPEYSTKFAKWSKDLVKAAEHRLGLPREHIVYLAETQDQGADGVSRKGDIEGALHGIAAKAASGDTVFLILIGHGTARGDRVLFNIPGPDLSAEELDGMLAHHDTLHWVVVNGSPSSGPFVQPLSAPNRIVITATANAAERFHTVFPEHFIAAYAKPGADSDKNGRVSVLEAFTFATREVARSYTQAGTILSEHAILEDTGALARATYLEADRTQFAENIPPDELDRLLAERDDLESRIATLIAGKPRFDPVVYDERLESLLVRFALVHRALRPAEVAQ
jgi:hypothetical protein